MIKDQATEGINNPYYLHGFLPSSYDPFLNCKVLLVSDKIQLFPTVPISESYKEDFLCDVSGPFAIEFFIRPINIPRETYIISWPAQTTVYIAITPEKKIHLFGFQESDYSQGSGILSTITLDNPDWNHVCLQRIDDNHMQLYINGFLSDQWEWNGTIQTGTSVNIGNYYNM